MILKGAWPSYTPHLLIIISTILMLILRRRIKVIKKA
jgi:hypothetical protein